MSRGHGRIEQAILAHVATIGPYDRTPMRQLASLVYNTDEPTRAQMVSLRRAVQRLEGQGLVDSVRDSAYATPGRSYERRGRRAYWCTAQGEPWQSKTTPGRCLHCEAGVPQEDDADGRGHIHVPPVTVRGVVEKGVGRPRASITEEERAAEIARVRAALHATEKRITG
jgi:hypothetical protein